MQAMYGAIIGDIVGSVYEFNNIKTKEFPFFSPDCFFTDDTVMTIAVAEALLRQHECARFDTSGSEEADERWRKVFQSSMRQYGRMYPNRGYGRRFMAWLMSDDPQPYGSAGNGSAMRVSPIAWFSDTLEGCEHLARLSAEVTHNSKDGINGAVAVAGATWLALNNRSKEDILNYVRKFYAVDFTLDEIRPSYHFGKFESLNAGTVPFAVEAFVESESFEDAIRNAISIGGDSDTLAAITGSIAEAFYGVPRELQRRADRYLTPVLERTLFRCDHIGWL